MIITGLALEALEVLRGYRKDDDGEPGGKVAREVNMRN
jgi:hypothetical protein